MCPHTTVVSTALATGRYVRRADLPLSWRGVTIAANTLSKSARLRTAWVITVRDLGYLSSVMLPERLRT